MTPQRTESAICVNERVDQGNVDPVGETENRIYLGCSIYTYR